MNEIRWVADGRGNMQLQHRTRGVQTDASCAFCGFTEWSEWQAVPIIHNSDCIRPIIDELDTRK